MYAEREDLNYMRSNLKDKQYWKLGGGADKKWNVPIKGRLLFENQVTLKSSKIYKICLILNHAVVTKHTQVLSYLSSLKITFFFFFISFSFPSSTYEINESRSSPHFMAAMLEN